MLCHGKSYLSKTGDSDPAVTFFDPYGANNTYTSDKKLHKHQHQ
jgi:hypothetical protein